MVVVKSMHEETKEEKTKTSEIIYIQKKLFNVLSL